MSSIPKICRCPVLGVLLVLGLTANAASAADKMNADQLSETLGDQPGLESEEGQLKGAIIQGEVLHVDSANDFVRGQDSKEMRLTDQITPEKENIRVRDRREPTVNDQNRATKTGDLMQGR